MRSLIKVIPLIVLGLILGINAPAKADVNLFQDLKLPDVEIPDWAVGQSATYNINISGAEDMEGDISADLRLAIVGSEKIEGIEYFWYEIDIDNIKGLPPEVKLIFSKAKLKMLTSFFDPKKFQNNPRQMMQDYADGKIVRKVAFQINEDTPQMIDFETIKSLLMNLVGLDLNSIANAIPETELSNIKEIRDIQFNSGKEDIKSPAGDFKNAMYISFSLDEGNESVKGKYHFHEKIPVTGLLKVFFNIKDAGDNIKLDINLTDYQLKGAKSMITGTPKPFDISELCTGQNIHLFR